MLCSKDLYKLLNKKFIQNVELPLSVIKKWNNEKLSLVRKIIVDEKLFESMFSFDVTFNTKYRIKLNKNGLLPNLTEMSFCYSFNEPIKKEKFPDHLTKISFGKLFDKPFAENVLPNSLTELIFDCRFNQILVQVFCLKI